MKRVQDGAIKPAIANVVFVLSLNEKHKQKITYLKVKITITKKASSFNTQV